MVCWPEYGVTGVGCFKSYGWFLAAIVVVGFDHCNGGCYRSFLVDIMKLQDNG